MRIKIAVMRDDGDRSTDWTTVQATEYDDAGGEPGSFITAEVIDADVARLASRAKTELGLAPGGG